MHSEKRTGDITELKICHHFLKEGYEVFKNVSCTGIIDIILFNKHTGEVTLLDAKTPIISQKKDGTIRLSSGKTTDRQKELNIKVVCVYNNKSYMSNHCIGEVIYEKEKIS